jgi:hypothetical protein
VATLTSVKSGRWSDPTTWDLGRVPAAGDQVVIASGHTVTYDIVEGSANDVVLGTAGNSLDIDIYGTLQFDTSATQPLSLRFNGYIYLRSTGKFICGTEDQPMPVKVTIYKATAGYYMFYFDNGAQISLVGSPNIPYDPQQGWYRFVTTLASAASSGATQITVTDDLNWQVGDYIVMPRLPISEDGYMNPPGGRFAFLAQVTAVSGNTLTLSNSLPHAYPAGAWVAKVNRSIVVSHITTSNAYSFTGTSTLSNRLFFNGLQWVFWFTRSGTVGGPFGGTPTLSCSKISYMSMLPHTVDYTIDFVFPSNPSPFIVEYHAGIIPSSSNVPASIIARGGVILHTAYLYYWRFYSRVEDAYVWNFNLTQGSGDGIGRVEFRRCKFFACAPYWSGIVYISDSDIWGFHHSWGRESQTITRNCRFYNYSHLGYSTTLRNRFDWYRNTPILSIHQNGEFYGTWVEPYDFTPMIGSERPKVRFVNKKVGSTVIKEQEFQAGGIITADEATLPPAGASAYSLKFGPKNPNLPLVYDIPLPPKTRMVVYFRHDGSSSLRDALIAVVNLADQYVADPLSVAMESVDCLTYPANQWNFIIIENMEDTAKILRLMARGTAGAVWFMSFAWPIFVAEPIDIGITEDELEVDISA